MNLLLDSPDAVPYFTNAGATLAALGVDPADFDWYVSDIETNLRFEGLPQADGWISGPDLAVVLSHADLQFIWGVFSAFALGARPEIRQGPTADGNPRYWRDTGSLVPELKGALFELVCWDSSATILIGITSDQAERFVAAYPMARPLSKANRDA